MTISSVNPFRVPLSKPWLASALETMLGLTPLATAYDNRPNNLNSEDFLDYTLSSLSCNVKLTGQDIHQAIPESGPTLVVANHPYGGIEGVALTRALLSVRPDTRVLTNQMLSSIPELSPIFFSVNVLGKNVTQANSNGVRKADNHLKQGGLLLVFPAGQVSSASWTTRQVIDRTWNSMVGRLALKYKATCVPVFIKGTNPLYFQLAGLIHKRLRTLLLPRQLSNKIGKTLSMTIGQPIRAVEYSKLENAHAITNLFRMSTYLLANVDNNYRREPLTPIDEVTDQPTSQEVLDELENLSQYKLLNKSNFDVYCAPFSALNHVFKAIAQAREITFRDAGEGTGNELDADQYDPHYYHLFIWDNEKNAVVGGYRLGETQKIVNNKGVNGLYSRSMYQYNADFINNMGNALEVGRSFVTKAYQRHPYALDLLWRGIGRFISTRPKYAILFGCVSISSSHSEMARAFISDAMMESFRAEQKYLQNVKPIEPLRVKGKVWSAKMLKPIRDISIFNKLVGQCDPGKTIPILLRHYLALNGRFIGFSVNKGFNESLDGLILVDLRKMPSRYLKRYLGNESAEQFLNYWNENEVNL